MTVSPSCCASRSACRDTPASGAPVTAIRTWIRQHTSAYVRILQHTSAYVSARDRAIRICSSMRTYKGRIHQ